MKKRAMRQELLNRELIAYSPKKWRINIPFRDYTYRMEDMVPALSGVIGKVSLIAAFAVAWAAGFNITDPSFVVENVRLEIVLGSLFTLLFCAILNPYAGPPGTLAPLIPLIPVIASSGVHPLPLGILIGLIGLLICALRYFDRIVAINGPGTKGGILLLFGFLGIGSSLERLRDWADSTHAPGLFALLLVVGLSLYVLLGRLGARWFIIPACAAAAIAIPSLFGLAPELKTGMALPILNPEVWWNEKWGIGFGLSAGNFIKALPFAILAVVMWPIDALAIKTIQETHYPKEADKAVFDMNSTYTVVAIRTIAGALLGGSQISAIWRSFMIPLGIVRRPIGASALLLGILGVSCGVLGFPIDIAVYPPMLWLVLIFGVYIPLWEVGLTTIKSAASAQVAAVCILAGIAINPVLGWVAAISIENFIMAGDSKSDRVLSVKDRYLTAGLVVITMVTFLSTYIL